MAANRPADQAGAVSRQFLQAAFRLAGSLGVRHLLIPADEPDDVATAEVLRTAQRIIWLTDTSGDGFTPRAPNDRVIGCPAAGLAPTSRVKLALFLAALRGFLGPEENVLCVAGLDSESLDSITYTSPQRQFPWLRGRDLTNLRGAAATREFARVLDIALRFAAEGREGKPIGTIFVLGDMGRVSPFLRQLILNPFAGHSPERRNIHNPDFLETLREFAAMDGAFVVSDAGYVELGGAYIDAPPTQASLRPGLGARHTAAAGLTAATAAIAVVVSESSGDVTVFHDGQAVLELEKPGAGSGGATFAAASLPASSPMVPSGPPDHEQGGRGI
jgi:hypothetical protein